MKKLKQILTNQFMWNCITAVCGIILSCCYIWEKDYIIALCWIFITISNILLAWLHKDDDAYNDDRFN